MKHIVHKEKNRLADENKRLRTIASQLMIAGAGGSAHLAGMIASLTAQGHNIRNATIISMYIHGKAADLLSKSISQRGMIASDLLYKIGRNFSDYEL